MRLSASKLRLAAARITGLFVLFFFCQSAIAQDRKISGVVQDGAKVPVIGASVKVKGSNTGVATDENGRYTISVPTNGTTLVFTSIGFRTREMPVGSADQLNVTLTEEAKGLNEVVVVGYGTLKQKEVTSAVAHIDTAQFRQSGARNALDLVQGKVAGLQITRSAGSNPNSSPNTQLRGVVSVTGSASPLYVIDGIPGGNPDLLQQDDIQSIDVLKDGSGAAIYGTSANAGVILITTKKGKPGAPQFSYNTYFRKEYAYNAPDVFSPDEFRQQIAAGSLGGASRPDSGSSTNFYDQLINRQNLSQNHNLSMSGGTDKTSYRASLNYRDLQGIAKENSRKEYTMRLNVNQKALNDRVNMSMNLASNFNNANLLGGGGWEEEAFKNPTFSNFLPDGSYRFDLTSTNNYARLFQETNYRKQQTSSADAKVDVDIIEGLRGTVFGSVQRNTYTDGAYRLLASEDSQENGDYPGGGYAYKGSTLEQMFAIEPTLQYTRTIAEKHNFTALAGYSYRYNIYEGETLENRGFISDGFHEDNIATGTALTDGRANMSTYKNDNTLIAFFGRVNYAFDNKYLIQFILRHEGSSRFGANNKWGNFPAVSAGWNISQEDFMKDVSFVDYLKLRVGYGVTGNSGFSNNASRLTLGGGGRYLYPDGVYRETYGPDRNPNPNLRWESKRETNIGLDFTLFKGKLTGALDLFDRTTKDLLDTYTSPQPPFIRNEIYTNVGQISSRGIEIAMSYNAIKNKDFSWTMDMTASTLRNRMDSYSNDQYKIAYLERSGIGGAGDLGNATTIFEGGLIGQFFGKRFAGFTDDGKWLFYNRNGEAVRNDQINNSRNDLNASDLAVIGNAVPKYYASFTSNFTYKNFDFRVFLRGKFDYDILNATALTYGNKVWSGNLLRNSVTKYAQLNDTYMYSDYYLESGSHVKLDEVTLGYTFKLNTKSIRNLRAYITGQNLATFTGYSGNDPDFIIDTGLDPGVDGRGPYPTTRSFLFGVSVGF
ncbi:MAG: SusC/RagA family TonB-linked outer membrane protein [Mucilaginibacter polytrichastri]|nr:SusC/RagA family TonB-linked outer membrane protein [Mucilaginibacter polytrichastri]